MATWSLAQPPDAPGTILAESLPDHRLAYWDYEGTLSGGRGEVVRWDRGTYELLHRTEREWSVVLCGSRLRGRVRLLRQSSPLTEWQFIFVSAGRPIEP